MFVIHVLRGSFVVSLASARACDSVEFEACVWESACLRACFFVHVCVFANAWSSRHNWIYASSGFSFRSANCHRRRRDDERRQRRSGWSDVCILYECAAVCVALSDRECVSGRACACVCVCAKHLRKLEKYRVHMFINQYAPAKYIRAYSLAYCM